MESSEQTQVLDALHSIASGNVSLEALKTVGNISTKNGGKVYLELQPEILSLRYDPLLTMLDTMESNILETLFENAQLGCEVCKYMYFDFKERRAVAFTLSLSDFHCF